jgi:hypothetical protein
MTKIGIVSKLDHCKAHKTALENLGFEVVLLGSSPTSFPESLRVVVVRVLSISHGGDKCARVWGKEPGRVLIFENGLTGILRKLHEFGILKEDPHVAELSCVPNPRSFTESGPLSSYPKYLSAQKVSLAYAAVLEVFRKIPDSMVSEARSLTVISSPEEFSPRVKKFCALVRPFFKYSGDPTSAFIFLYLFSEPGFTPYVKDILGCYTDLSKKETSYAFPRVVAWHLGFPSPISFKHQLRVSTKTEECQDPDPIATSQVEECQDFLPVADLEQPPDPQPATPKPTEPTVATLVAPPVPPEISSVLSSNTDSILGLMIEVEGLRRTVETLSGMVEKLLESRISPTSHTNHLSTSDLPDIRAKLASAGFKGQLTLNVE